MRKKQETSGEGEARLGGRGGKNMWLVRQGCTRLVRGGQNTGLVRKERQEHVTRGGKNRG